MRQFATDITIVSVDGDGDKHGMAANSFTSVSLDPPLVFFNANHGTNTQIGSPRRDTTR